MWDVRALSAELELDGLGVDIGEGEAEVVGSADDGGVEAAGKDLCGERVRGLYEEDPAIAIEGQGMGVVEVGPEVGFSDFARKRAFYFSPQFF